MMWGLAKTSNRYLDPKYGFGLFRSLPVMVTVLHSQKIKKSDDSFYA